MNTLAQRGLLDSLATERISHAVLEPGKAMKKISLEPMVIAQPAPVAGAPLAETRALKDACVEPELGPFHMDGIHEMESDKKRRHEEAWETFHAEASVTMLLMKEKCGQVSAGFKQKLGDSDVYVEGVLSNLADDKIMLLEEDGVKDLWEKTIEQAEPRRKWIEEFASDLEAVENERKETMDMLGQLLLEVLVDVRWAAEGDTERAVEKEALQVNLAILENRRVHAELIRRLQTQEVKQEKERRERWVEGMQRWRMLRTRHTIATFKARILSEEFQEPPPRVAQIGGVREEQGRVHGALVEHLGVAASLLPPALSTPNVLQWVEEASAMLDAWGAAYDGKFAGLASLEEGLQALEEELVSTLRADCARYGAMSEEETEAMIEEECMVLVTARREAAATLHGGLVVFVSEQAAGWRDTAARMGDFMKGCARLMETQHAAVKDLDAQAAEDLKGCREAFNADDSSREEALERALTALRQGGSEKALDDRQAKALAALDDIEEGYRSFQKDMVSIAKKHPVDHKELADQYERDLCTFLRLKFNVDPLPEPEPEPVEGEEGDAKDEPPPPPAKGAKKPDPKAAEVEPEEEPEPEPEPELPPGPPVYTAKGTEFALAVDIYEDVFIPKPPEEPEPEEPAEGEEAPAPPEPTKDEEGEEPDEPEPEEEPYTGPPLDPAGEPYVLALLVPEAVLRGVLEEAQRTLLDEKEAAAQVVEERTATWAQNKEENLTAELDTSLRRHRPRAGRIEEEVRLSRSIELVEQERRHNRHMRSLARAFKGQQAQYDADLAAAREEMLASVAKMAAAEGYLNTASSCKTLEVRQREAGKLQGKIEAALRAKAAAMQEQVDAACAEILAANEKFVKENLKNFDEGGLYAPGSIARYLKQIKQSGESAKSLLSSRKAEVAALEGEMLAGSQAARDSFESMIPFHQEDLTLLEGIDKAVDSTRFKLRREFERSDEAAAAITAKLGELRALAETSEEAGAAKGEAQTNDVIACIDGLRRLVHPRAQYLEYLAEECQLAVDDIDLSLDAPAGGAEEGAEAADPKKGGKAAPPPPDPKAKGGKEAAPEGGEEAPANLMAIVDSLVDGSKEALGGVGEAYYAEKSPDRAITRPKRIPEGVEELNTRNAEQLEEFMQQAAAHLAAARTELRKQVITAAELLARAPATALHGLYAAAAAVAEEELASLNRRNDRARKPLVAQQNVHRDELRPGMSAPHKLPLLEALCGRETERAQASTDNLWAHVGSCMEEADGKARGFATRFQRAAEVLLALLDASVLPDDLPPIGDDADAIRLLTRKNIKQLKWLDEMGRGFEIEYREREGRSYRERDWPPLPLGTLSLESAGWAGEKELREALGEVEEPAEGEEPPPEEAKEEEGEAPPPVAALDTPCQHAVVAARDRYFKLYRKGLYARVGAAKGGVLTGLKQEALWKLNWEHLV
eukprot:CAMPEP_0182902436 /NCGR_PEP_ID=MMETSP0034_2-20130328/30461_1 /TAXON_ID=156128 /ORGANISM="Nephroselmis pyriformis, Strain CCMP717" /LENGTH=1432 /DNA_ID=CAMNT_0025037103 /DNA_START=83 /DNA_END=4378 /DNA_ORIENTATION=-